MTVQEKYNAKLHTLDDCIHSIRSGESITVAGAASEPTEFLKHVQDFAPYVTDVTILKTRDNDYAYLRDPSVSGHVFTYGHFYNKNLRDGHKLGLCDFVPGDLHDFMINRIAYSPNDTFWAQVSPMDSEGNFCVSYGQMYEREAFQSAKRVVLEVNRQARPIRGGVVISIDRADLIYEVDVPLTSVGQAPATELDQTIGAYIADMIHDGDCLQLGWGGLPDVVAARLMDKNDLGMHTEVCTTTLAKMIEAGVITGKRKQIDRGEHIAAFAMGTPELYDIIAENPAFRLMPSSYANDPFIISQNNNVVSVNTALEIDLTGQVCSESIGPHQFSGTGGATDFADGALRSKGGRGILALHSTAKNGTISKIKTTLTPGSAVSIRRNSVDHIITEYGVAQLRGRSLRERAAALIEIAHPAFRDQLRYEAKQIGLLP